ncbi:LTA synthase family protein [Photobacterium sp. GB-210]|uniref:LTA synthase family protein n=1 Tax=Photobacterium sp. GB-210 TaxID=2022104 RepID=UPI000D159EFB|nr:LTA synthase family protein [Photobacterium sp. GB-210]PSV34089.1 phosphoglycerol transferase [Photobacterium sp. GB-210]
MLAINTIISFAFLIAAIFITKLLALLSFVELPIELSSQDGIDALLFGIYFDASAAVLLTIPIFLTLIIASLFKRATNQLTRFLLCIAIFWVVITTFSDAIYAKEASKHVTFELFNTQGMEVSLIQTAFKSYFGTVALGIACLLVSLFFIWKYLPLSNRKQASWYFNSLFIFLWLAVTLIIVRGGWKDSPQSPMSVYTIGDLDKAFIAWNAPYSIGYYLSKGDLAAIEKITKNPTSQQVKFFEHTQETASPAQLQSLKSANVIVVLLESWLAFDMQSYSGVVNATPFFDQLRARSFSTYSTYADAYRTVQGTFSTFCSYPNPINGFMANSQLQNASYSCLPHILAERGWQTAFIQGSGRGAVGAFAQTLGFEESYGKYDYPFKAVHNEWGFMDDDIYRFSLNQIDKFSQTGKPFLMTINTGTTHGSFLPDNVEYVFGRENIINERRSVMKYADDALKRFIPKLDSKLAQLDKPTIVILLSDHTAKTITGGLVKNSIPLLIYASDQSIPNEKRSITSSQRDIAPTIIDWLGGYVPWFTGNSLFDDSYDGRSSFSYGTNFFWLTKNHGVAIDSATGELHSCFDIDNDVVTKKPLACSEQAWSESLFAEGSYFNAISQQLLFEGKTQQYRKVNTKL